MSNMDDMEKSRATHVLTLELSLEHIRAEYLKYKTLAEKWEPVVTTTVDTASGNTTFGLRFGGKNVHATITPSYLLQMDTAGATASIVNALVESLVVDQLRTVIQPIVERAQQGAKAISNAGNWK